ncbi:hypothetical protein KQX54_000726 [Cotesia glomerata]|uniref:Uncharacterized protein n=1 Tax=Cotesia glomerata TaxID=32391 RepID=A0AAV7IBR4_COTGL|nr:hypothetical protein KQX54_000726 [Cotesia glomerata]
MESLTLAPLKLVLDLVLLHQDDPSILPTQTPKLFKRIHDHHGKHDGHGKQDSFEAERGDLSGKPGGVASRICLTVPQGTQS